VLVSDLTFIAPANAVRYTGAWPVFIDAERVTWQIDAQKVVDFLAKECDGRGGMLRNRKTGRRVRAILPVHVLGHTCDMDPILEVARRFGLAVIEDATECLGASYKGRPAGALGDIGCFSFNGNKLITTGGGGMVVTDNAEWAARVKHLSTQAKADPLEYEHDEVGYNYRLTNIQAALGVAQLEAAGRVHRRQAPHRRRLPRTTPGSARHHAHAGAGVGRQRLVDVHSPGGRGALRPGQPRSAPGSCRRVDPGPAACGSRCT